MCGLYGVVGGDYLPRDLATLKKLSSRRGSDAAGTFSYGKKHFWVDRSAGKASASPSNVQSEESSITGGHSRLITHGHTDNQPIWRSGILVLHNGIVLNSADLWSALGETPKSNIDTEVIGALVRHGLNAGMGPTQACEAAMDRCDGVLNLAVLIPDQGTFVLCSNNGSLYVGAKGSSVYFASEEFALRTIRAESVRQVHGATTYDVPTSQRDPVISEIKTSSPVLIPTPKLKTGEANLLSFPPEKLQRCSRCILPESMPFIAFGQDGVCNYCQNYKKKVSQADNPEEKLLERLEQTGLDAVKRTVLMPFSGGRDSSYGLHLAVKRLGIKPIAFTYDWGMLSDVGRRNASRMCAALGVEQIVVAADIAKKRRYIQKNVVAWLARPNLGMVNLFTAGDKHFFKFLTILRAETGIRPNLWSFNPLETTHFKTGFLGMAPDFQKDEVYKRGLSPQLRYQFARARETTKNRGYLNSSVLDTLSGEFHRSVAKKTDYSEVFDFFKWDEKAVDSTLKDLYEWEVAPESPSTWRIGDATAAFYNYIFRRVAGFSEYDTFRSNQVREGHLSRAAALELSRAENVPRYRDIKWYLEAIGLEFGPTIRTINNMPRLY